MLLQFGISRLISTVEYSILLLSIFIFLEMILLNLTTTKNYLLAKLLLELAVMDVDELDADPEP